MSEILNQVQDDKSKKFQIFLFRFRSHFMAIGPQEMHVAKPRGAFYLAASHPSTGSGRTVLADHGETSA